MRTNNLHSFLAKVAHIVVFFTLSISTSALDIGPATISKDTTWSGTVNVTGDITVSSTGKLSIEPGTVVSFMGWYKLTVNGIISAIGELGDTIVFTRSDTAGFSITNSVAGGWRGIILQNTTSVTDSFVFRFCKIEYIKDEGPEVPNIITYIDGFRLNIERTLIKDNRGCIYTNGVENINIDSCTFYNSNKYKYYLLASNLTYGCRDITILKSSNINITSNTFQTSAYTVVALSEVKKAIVLNNIITSKNREDDNNGVNSFIKLYNSNDDYTEISNNTFISNSVYSASVIYLRESKILVDSNIFDVDYGTAIYIDGLSTGYIRNNKIVSCSNGITGYSSSFEINNNTIAQCEWSAISFSGFSIVTLENNIIKNSNIGIELTQTEAKINSNSICNCTKYGIFLNKLNATINNCLVANNSSPGSSSAIFVSTGTCNINSSTIVNNIDGNSLLAPITYKSSNGNIYNTIFNGNKISGSDNYQVCITENSIQPSFYYCGFANTTYALKFVDNATSHFGEFTEIVTGNPDFIKPTSGAGSSFDALGTTINWILSDTSLFINAGLSAVKTSETDIKGSQRVLNGRIDIGAFETYLSKDTFKGGNITGDVFWKADTIVIISDVYISNTGALFISPGVTVLFTDFYNIECDGLIKAIGTEEYPITFTIEDTSGFYNRNITDGGWKGVRFNKDITEKDTTQFNYCQFKYIKSRACNIENRNKFKIENSIFEFFKPVTMSESFFSFSNSVLEIRKNVFRNLDAYQIIIFTNSRAKITNNIFYSNNFYTLFGVGSAEAEILNNEVFNNDYHYLGSGPLITVVSSKGKLNNNLIFNNKVNQILGLASTSWSEFYVSNNTITENESYSFYLDIGSAIFENNIVTNNKESLIKIRGNINIPAICRNNYVSSSTEFVNVNCIDCIFDEDPMFLNPTTTRGCTPDATNSDWHLSVLSNAINKGYSDISNLPSTDFDGNKRLHDVRVDIGAYENQGSVPLITMHPTGQSLCSGDSLVLQISTKDTARYQWQKDGKDIVGATSKTLIITNVFSANQAGYSCIASNSFGSVTSSVVNVNIKSAPDFLSSIENRFVIEGSELSVEIPVTGNKPITFIWYKNKIVNSSFNASSLKFISFGLSDEGNYNLSALNECGTDSSGTFSLSILPVTTIQGTDSIICEGDTVTLRTIAGSGASRQWRKNGSDIAGAKSEYLTINSIQTENTGSYSCMVSSKYGNMLTTPVYLIVNEFPKIVVQPVSQWTSTGESFTSEISAIGSKPLSYQWYKNDSVITGEDDPRFIIGGFQTKDEGQYYSKVDNICGTVKSSTAYIQITPKIVISNSSKKSTICENDTITLNANSGIGSTYQWYNDGSAVKDSISATLKFEKLAIADAGNYYCVVTKSGQSKQTETKTISVQTAPEVLLQPTSQWVAANNAYTLEVSVGGSKPLNYQWYKDGLTAAGTSINTNYIITGFAAANEGRYACKIQNTCGSVTSTDAYLYISPKINVINNNGKNSLCENDTITLNADSGAGSTYQWYKDGSVVKDSTSATIVFKKISVNNAGNYYCVVTKSSQSKQTETKTISVQTAPGIISQPQSEWIYQGSTHKLAVVAEGSKPMNYLWTKDVTPLSSLLSEIIFDEFASENEGNYEVKITNVCGDVMSNAASLNVAPELTNNSGSSVCENDTFELGVAFNDSAKYQWVKEGKAIAGATSKTYAIKKVSANDIGNYQCRVSNANGYAILGPVQLTLRKSPSVEMLDSTTYVDATLSVSIEATAAGDEPLEYKWFKNDSALSGNISGSLAINGVTTGDEANYKCRVKNNCGELETNETRLVIAPQLCMVTNDFETDSNSNLLVWDRNSSYAYHHFNVYRESYIRDKYDKIGEVPYKALTTFIDETVNPKSQAYMYKITAVDSVNKETDINFTAPHKTIHLLVTQGIPEGIQLDWDEYIGFDYSTYSIFRSVDNAAFEKIDSMASTSRTWTDFSAPVTKDLKYFVSVKREEACYANTQKKAGAGPFVSAYSNMEDNSRIKWTVDAIDNIQIKGFEVYPNPFTNTAKIKYRLEKTLDVSITLYDFSGRMIKTITENVQIAGNYNYKFGEELQKGVYFLKVRVGDKTDIVKVVKIK